MGMTSGSTGMNFLKGGLTGLSQGLANYNNPHPVYNFSGLGEGFQAARQQPKVIDMSSSLNEASVIPKPYTGPNVSPDLQLVSNANGQPDFSSLFPQPKYGAPTLAPQQNNASTQGSDDEEEEDEDNYDY